MSKANVTYASTEVNVKITDNCARPGPHRLFWPVWDVAWVSTHRYIRPRVYACGWSNAHASALADPKALRVTMFVGVPDTCFDLGPHMRVHKG